MRQIGVSISREQRLLCLGPEEKHVTLLRAVSRVSMGQICNSKGLMLMAQGHVSCEPQSNLCAREQGDKGETPSEASRPRTVPAWLL